MKHPSCPSPVRTRKLFSLCILDKVNAYSAREESSAGGVDQEIIHVADSDGTCNENGHNIDSLRDSALLGGNRGRKNDLWHQGNS